MTFVSSATRGARTQEKNGLHPGAWLAWAASAGLTAVSTTNPFYLVPLVASAWVVHSFCGRSGSALRSFRVFAMFAAAAVLVRTALVAFGPMGAGSVAGAALEGARLGVLLIVFGTFNSVTDPARVLKLAPRRFHESALAAALALSIAPRTIASVERVREAQHLRGLTVARWRGWAALAVPVLQSGLDDALVLAESMDARGHGRGRRSRYRIERAGAASVIVGALAAAAAAMFIVAGITGNGDLVPSMTPPSWPDATGALVGAVFAFAAPALFGGRRD